MSEALEQLIRSMDKKLDYFIARHDKLEEKVNTIHTRQSKVLGVLAVCGAFLGAGLKHIWEKLT